MNRINFTGSPIFLEDRFLEWTSLPGPRKEIYCSGQRFDGWPRTENFSLGRPEYVCVENSWLNRAKSSIRGSSSNAVNLFGPCAAVNNSDQGSKGPSKNKQLSIGTRYICKQSTCQSLAAGLSAGLIKTLFLIKVGQLV